MKIKPLVALLILALTACIEAPKQNLPNNTQNIANRASDKKIRIGFAMDTVKEERWQRDHDAFEAQCAKLNVQCEITVADNKADKQANDVDNLLTKGIDVLVIAPHDATQAAS